MQRELVSNPSDIILYSENFDTINAQVKNLFDKNWSFKPNIDQSHPSRSLPPMFERDKIDTEIYLDTLKLMQNEGRLIDYVRGNLFVPRLEISKLRLGRNILKTSLIDTRKPSDVFLQLELALSADVHGEYFYHAHTNLCPELFEKFPILHDYI